MGMYVCKTSLGHALEISAPTVGMLFDKTKSL
jgi:hypothetical protein